MGRSSLIMVMGFNVIFATMGFNISRVAVDAYQNNINYYTNTVSHDIAASAANIAASAFHVNSGAISNADLFTNRAFFGGTMSTSISDLGYKNRKQIIAIGKYMNRTDSIIIVLQPSSFSKFGFYTNDENGVYWINGDTCYGPFHTQGQMYISGNSPVFMQKATTKLGISKNPSSSTATFLGGYQSGVDVVLPVDMSQLLAGVNNPPGGRKTLNVDVQLKFRANGTVDYKEGAAAWANAPLSTYCPNGIIYVDKGNLRIRGTVKGRYTVAAIQNGASGKGNIWIDSSVVYQAGGVMTNTQDILGICADNNITIADSTQNLSSIKIHGSYFARAGSFSVENYGSGSPRGRIWLFGGIQQKTRGPVGTFSGSTLQTGYYKSYVYDLRLQTQSPPAFPTTGTYEVLSWYE
jgi:hypothetical protein